MLELTEQYIPEKFLFREDQVKKIKETFIDFKKTGISTNLILLGTTGAGKTSVLKRIIKDNDNTIFVSCSEHKSTNKILRFLSGKKFHCDSDLQKALIEQLKETPKILIIDEVGKIDDMERFCNTINTIYRNTNVPIILATNKWTFIQEMPDDARLTLFFNRVEFPYYDAIQLKAILNERLKLVEDRVSFRFSDESLSYLCGKVVKEQFSSVRVALVILNQCISSKNDSIKFIDKQFEYLVEMEWRDFIYKLNDIEKEFLGVLLELSETQLEMPVPEISSKLGGAVSPSKMSKMVTAFMDYGIIKAKWKHLGRAGGKHRIIFFSKPQYRIKLLKLLTPWE